MQRIAHDGQGDEAWIGFAHILNLVTTAATEAEGPDDVLGLALEQVCAYTGWPVGHAYLWDRARELLFPSPLWHMDDPGRFATFRTVTESTAFRRGQGLPGRVLETGEPVWISDVSRDPDFPRAGLATDLGVTSAFAFPVPTADGVVAVLEFFSGDAAAPDEPLLALMAVVGAQLGRVFERVGSAAAVREREERFRALAENAADAIVTIDEDDRIIFANPAVERVFGYGAEELAEMSFVRLMPERYRDRHREGIRRYARRGVRRIPWDGIELPGLHRDGHEIPLEITFGEFVRGGRHYFTGIMRDIGERKRSEADRAELLERERGAREAAEEARREAERRARQEAALRQAAAAVSAAFTAEDTARLIAENALVATRADGAFVERVVVGSGDVEVVAMAGECVPPLGSRVPYRTSFSQVAIEREEPQIIARLGDADRPLPANLRDLCDACTAAVIPLLDAGEPIGSLILLREPHKSTFRQDEVERAFTFGELAGLAFRKIHLLEDSERRREELQRVMESRSRLMRGFSHDVKNPLGAADGFLQLVAEGIHGDLNERQSSAIAKARRSLRAALDLIEDLLELARAESGQLEIRIAPTDVLEAVREVAEEYRPQAEAAGLDLIIDLPGDFPVIESDPNRIRQVVGNLVSNAVKYTGEGSVRVEIVAQPSPDRGQDRVLVTVRDTGPGIPSSKRQILFEEFTRLDPDAREGAGIGLAISRRIAHALGGDILLESEVGRGSEFTFWLPLLPPGEGAGPAAARAAGGAPTAEVGD